MMSLVSQDNVSQFSYCLSPFANREARSQLFFGLMVSSRGLKPPPLDPTLYLGH
jgi:hypothetical protein